MNKRGIGFAIAIAAVLVVWMIILAVVFKVSLDRLQAPSWGNPIGSKTSIEVTTDTRVGQLFTAPWPGLYRVDLVLDEASSSGSRPITFHLKSGPDTEEDLWTATFDATDITGTGVRTFEFPPMPGAKGQIFYFYVESPDSTTGDAIAVGHSPGANLNGAQAHIDDQPAAGSLQFNTYYSLRTRDRIDLLLTRLTEGRSYFMGSKAFYAGLAMAYGLVLGAFLCLTTWVVLQEQERRT